MAPLRAMLFWLALLGMLIGLASLAASNAGLRLPADWLARCDLALVGLALLALIFAVRPSALALLAVAPFVAALATWAWAFGLRSAGFAGLILMCSSLAGFADRQPDPLAGLPIAAVIASVALIGRERWAIAGGLLGYATIVAGWPGLFALAGVAKLSLGPGRPTWTGLLGFAGVGLLAAVLPEHAASASWGLAEPDPAGPRAVGLRWLFALDGDLGGPSGKRWLDYPAKLEVVRERSEWLWICATTLMIPVLAGIRRLEPARFVAIVGCTGLLAWTSVDAQVWMVVCVLAAGRAPTRPLTLACAGALAVDLGLRALAQVQPPPVLYNVGATSLLGLLVLGLGVTVLVEPPEAES